MTVVAVRSSWQPPHTRLSFGATREPHGLGEQRHAEHVDRLEVERDVRGHRREPRAVGRRRATPRLAWPSNIVVPNMLREALLRREAFHHAHAVDLARVERVQARLVDVHRADQELTAEVGVGRRARRPAARCGSGAGAGRCPTSRGRRGSGGAAGARCRRGRRRSSPRGRPRRARRTPPGHRPTRRCRSGLSFASSGYAS